MTNRIVVQLDEVNASSQTVGMSQQTHPQSQPLMSQQPSQPPFSQQSDQFEYPFSQQVIPVIQHAWQMPALQKNAIGEAQD